MNTSTTGIITVNGRSWRVMPGQTVASLLRSTGIELDPERCVVELNRRALTRREVKFTALQPGDVVEIAQIVAGG